PNRYILAADLGTKRLSARFVLTSDTVYSGYAGLTTGNSSNAPAARPACDSCLPIYAGSEYSGALTVESDWTIGTRRKTCPANLAWFKARVRSQLIGAPYGRAGGRHVIFAFGGYGRR